MWFINLIGDILYFCVKTGFKFIFWSVILVMLAASAFEVFGARADQKLWNSVERRITGAPEGSELVCPICNENHVIKHGDDVICDDPKCEVKYEESKRKYGKDY